MTCPNSTHLFHIPTPHIPYRSPSPGLVLERRSLQWAWGGLCRCPGHLVWYFAAVNTFVGDQMRCGAITDSQTRPPNHLK